MKRIDPEQPPYAEDSTRTCVGLRIVLAAAIVWMLAVAAVIVVATGSGA